MTRILQIRRGSAAQNDNFTGLNGEITMDTTNKTLRVHDGETLGGIALARADEIPDAQGAEAFDINSVSSEFWQTLFATYQTSGIQSASTSLITVVSNATFYDNSFEDLSSLPLYATATLVCQSDDAGYTTGDETTAFGIGDYTYPLIYTYVADSILHTRLFAGGQTFWVPKKTTGIKTNVTNTKWKLKITVYY